MNKVELVGRMTRDAKLFEGSNTSIAKFTLACDKYGDGADFIPIVAFGRQAENIAQYVKKGHLLSVVGRIQTGSYEKDGETIYTMDIVAESAEFIEPKRDKTEEPTKSEEKTVEEPTYADDIDFDIPF